MEVLQDTHKDTKVGRIPKDWEVVKLKEVCCVEYGKDQKKVENPNGKYGIYGTGGLMNYSDEFLYNKPSVLIGRKGTIDKPRYIDIPFWTVDTLFYTKVFDDVDVKWFYYKCVRIPWRTLNEATGVPSLNRNNIYSFKISLPTLPEQQKIAAILSTVDEQISTTDKIIKKSKELKKGLMQRFFLNKAYMIMSLGEAEKTELMPIKFKALGKILTGTTPPTANKEYYDSEDYMFIGPADLGKVKDVKSSKKYISVKGFDVTRKLPENALMVVCIGATIGKIGLTTEPCATNQQVNTIVPNEEYSARYLYYVIGGLKKYLLGFAGDTATPQLNKTDFGKVVTFIHKSKSERTKIVAILLEADAKIEKEQIQKAHLEALKKGLMQQLLTGKKRVKV